MIPKITIGRGLREPQGERVELGGEKDAAALSDKLTRHDGGEAWWSTHSWAGDYRSKKNWESSIGIAIDLDYYAVARGHSPPPPEADARISEELGALPGTLTHRTPRGVRLVFLFAEPVTELETYRRAAIRAAVETESVLRELDLLGDVQEGVVNSPGLVVDRGALLDRARMLWTPRAHVPGEPEPRSADVVLLGGGTFEAQDLAALAPQEEAPPRVPRRPSEAPVGDHERRWAQAGLSRVAAELAEVPEGGRNQALNAAAYRFGRMAVGGLLDRDLVERELLSAALAADLSESEAARTLRSGLDAGMAAEPIRGPIAEMPPPHEEIPPPGDDESLPPELDAEAEAAMAGGPSDKPSQLALTETTMAEDVVRQHGKDLRFCGPMGKWFVWAGRRWRIDDSGRVQRRIKQTLRRAEARVLQAGEDDLFKAIAKLEKRNAREGIAVLARYEEAVQINPEQLDRDPMLFNVRNGTIDLRTGRLRPHQRTDFITKIAGLEYDPTTRAPLWAAFLDRIFDKNQGLIRFVQKAAGYSLTGEVGEQVFFILWGSGANGKSTLLDLLLAASGDYGMAGADELLLAAKGERHPTELADLFGRRLVACQETQEGRRFDESRVKRLTGGDPVKARRMREDFWQFSPAHKLWLGTNHRPAIRGTDYAIWRRVRLVPFIITIPPGERDKSLPEKLRRELPGILHWMVEGCLAWQHEGLEPPPEVTSATEAYREAEDRLAAFLAECCAVGASKQATAAAVYASYCAWAEENHEFVPSAKAFSESLAERGFERDRAGKDRQKIWRGIGLLDDRRTDADRFIDSPPNARVCETNRETGPHRSAEPKAGLWSGDDEPPASADPRGAPCRQ